MFFPFIRPAWLPWVFAMFASSSSVALHPVRPVHPARPVCTVCLTAPAPLPCFAPFGSSLSCFCCILLSVIFIESRCQLQCSALLRQHGFLLFCTFIYCVLTPSLCEHVLCSSCCLCLLQMLYALCWCYPNALAVSVSVSWFIFADIISPAVSASPQGNHFASTEQITNFVIFRSFHFISFRFVCFGCGQRGQQSMPASLLLRFYCF